jgi:6-phosphogluconolactonase
MTIMTALPLAHRVQVFPDAEALFQGAAALFVDAVSHLPRGARIVLPGGTTPRALYRQVLRASPTVDWNSFRYITSDERCVPLDHPESNFGRLWSGLLEPLRVTPDRVVRLRGEYPPEEAAEKAHRELVDLAQRVPLFDLVLLGLGEDGHTASLFPAEAWPEFGTRWAAATRHPDGSRRLTLTPAALRSTRTTWFLVVGSAKADAIARTLLAPEASPEVPARMAMGPEVLWLLDPEAAAGLPGSGDCR